MQHTLQARLKELLGSEGRPRHGPRSSVLRGCAAPRLSDEVTSQIKGSVFSPFFLPLMLERIDSSYRHLHLLNILAVCERLHKALCKRCNDLSPAIVKMIGGRTNAMPRKVQHLTFMPLAWVGHPNSDGRLLGIGLVLPEKITREERRGVFVTLERVAKEELKLGRFGKWRIQTIPQPYEVIVTPVSAHFGAPPATAFARFRKDASEWCHCHAILIFAEPVRGPILLGTGLHYGYGLCRPLPEEA